MSEQRCKLCQGPTVYQLFSAGCQYWCEPCGYQGEYDAETRPPRLKMMTEGYYDILRAEIRAELAARRTGRTAGS